MVDAAGEAAGCGAVKGLKRWAGRAAALTACVAMRAGAQSGPDRAFVGTFPASCDLVVATGALGSIRATPAWRCAERFAGEMGGWERTLEAWGQVAASLEMRGEEAEREFLSSPLVFVMEGLTDRARGEGVARHAVVTEISPEVERRLRERLRPAPRGLEGETPILSLENGAFDLSTSVMEGRATRLLISPRGSDALFDRLVGVVRGKADSRPLSESLQWGWAEALAPGRVMVLYRDMHPPQARVEGERFVAPGEHFVAATLNPVGEELRAEFVASRGVLMAGGEDGREEDVRSAWPGDGVELLEGGAVLLVAGDPREQPRDLALPGLGSAGGTGGMEETKGAGTLLLTMLDSLRLPESVRAGVEGTVVIALHPGGGEGSGVEGASPGDRDGWGWTVALPLQDVDAQEAGVDAWAMGLAGKVAGEGARVDAESIRVLTLGSRVPEGGPAFIRAGGAMAWTMRKGRGGAGGGEAGWCVVNFRTRAGMELEAAKWTREVGERLVGAGKEEGGGSATIFRLMLRPSRLLPRTTGGSENAFRWVKSLDTRLNEEPNGLVRGRMVMRFESALLEEDVRTPEGR